MISSLTSYDLLMSSIECLVDLLTTPVLLRVSFGKYTELVISAEQWKGEMLLPVPYDIDTRTQPLDCARLLPLARSRVY